MPPHINADQLFKKPNNPLPNLINDDSIIRSQSMSRFNLNTSTSKLKETNDSPEMRNSSQLAPMTSGQEILSENFRSQILIENRSIFLSNHEISEKVEGFIFSISTPHKLIEPQLTVTSPR